MSNYAFNFIQADVTITEMQQINQRITTALADLDASVQKSIQNWEGGARDEYYLAKQTWDNAALQMSSSFELARSTLVTISDFYGSAEVTGQMLWNGIAGA